MNLQYKQSDHILDNLGKSGNIVFPRKTWCFFETLQFQRSLDPLVYIYPRQCYIHCRSNHIFPPTFFGPLLQITLASSCNIFMSHSTQSSSARHGHGPRKTTATATAVVRHAANMVQRGRGVSAVKSGWGHGIKVILQLSGENLYRFDSTTVHESGENLYRF